MRWSVQDFKNETDEALAALVCKGDRAAAEALMLRYKDTVRGIARRSAFRILAEEDDLAQEGMIALYAAIGAYDPAQGSFRNFVYTCIVRRIYSYLRFVNRRETGERAEIDPEMLPLGESPEDRLLIDESDAEFRMWLAKELSDFEFRVVTMYLDGMRYADISEATGREIKSIDNALARAKRKLQKAFRG